MNPSTSKLVFDEVLQNSENNVKSQEVKHLLGKNQILKLKSCVEKKGTTEILKVEKCKL